MSALALSLGLLLTAAPAERVVVLPFEQLGIAPGRAADAEQAVRQGLSRLGGVEVVEPAAVRALLAAEPGLRDCLETRCLAAIAARLDAGSLISGVVAGLGSFRSIVLKRTDREGKVVTSVSEALGEDDAGIPRLICAVLGRPAACFDGGAAPASAVAVPAPGLRPTRRAALGVGAGAVAAFAVAAGFGLSARSIAGQVERQELSCGSSAADCLEDRLSTGRTHATVSNVFWAAGGALAATAVVLFVLPGSEAGVTLGPGPAPIGLSAHARF